MYRIRSADEDKLPLLIHPDIIREYEDNQVDTLHKKVNCFIYNIVQFYSPIQLS